MRVLAAVPGRVGVPPAPAGILPTGPNVGRSSISNRRAFDVRTRRRDACVGGRDAHPTRDRQTASAHLPMNTLPLPNPPPRRAFLNRAGLGLGGLALAEM